MSNPSNPFSPSESYPACGGFYPRRPGGLTAIAVIAAILGGLGLLGSVAAVAALAAGSRLQPVMMRLESPGRKVIEVQRDMQTRIQAVTDRSPLAPAGPGTKPVVEPLLRAVASDRNPKRERGRQGIPSLTLRVTMARQTIGQSQPSAADPFPAASSAIT